MTVDMGRYTELLDKFRGISQPYVDATVLERLKEKYKNVIDSPRQLEKIDNIASLLKVLEKRGVLQYDDINVLSDIAKDFVNDKAIEDLINDYNIWFNENSSRINNLYNCGKSPNLLNNKESKMYKTVNLCDFNKNESNHAPKDQCTESLLPNESTYNFNWSILNDPNNFFMTTITKRRRRHKKKTYFIIFIVTSILLIILSSIIWIMVILFYQSTVITSKANPPDKMPFYSSNFSMGFAVNQSQSFASTSRPNVDKERELQDLVISKLSKEVGRKWADVSRRLKIRESEIDAIQASNENYNYENMFKQALRLYFSEPHPTWKMDLKKALEASRRRDLREILEELFHERYS